MLELEDQLESILANNLREINILTNDLQTKEQEKQDLIKHFALHIINVLDSFEVIEEKIEEKGYNQVEEADKVLKRYASVYKKLLRILKSYGVSKIDFPDNRLIIGFCEVVETIPDPNRQNDDIVTVVKNGYMRGKELIRAAEVISVKN